MYHNPEVMQQRIYEIQNSSQFTVVKLSRNVKISLMCLYVYADIFTTR